MKIALVGYRDWALEIYSNIIENTDNEFLKIYSKDDFVKEKIIEFSPDYILFYGWSWIITGDLLEKYKCIMLHPSPLPKYRGGSPIQNQIINGEKKGAVTIFLMDNGIDTGPIISQQEISLTGSLNDVFKRIIEIGSKLSIEFINNGYNLLEQDHSQATIFKRRKETESEITLQEIMNNDAEYLFNKIRMLQEPYPKPYIKTADGKKLCILKATIED